MLNFGEHLGGREAGSDSCPRDTILYLFESACFLKRNWRSERGHREIRLSIRGRTGKGLTEEEMTRHGRGWRWWGTGVGRDLRRR